MPTPPKNSINMRKHLTKSEKESRQKAEGGLKRGTRVTLKMPTWLDEEAQGIWKDLRKKVRGLELLDNIDAEMLGLYCDALANYREYSKASRIPGSTEGDGEAESLVRLALQDGEKAESLGKLAMRYGEMAQSWGRLALQYAEKLGISPTARARLAKRKAEREAPDEMEELLDDVLEFVNDGQDAG